VPLLVDVVAADHLVWSGEAAMVVARTVDGEVGILPGHTPVLSLLAPGDLRVEPLDGDPVVATLTGGFLSVDHDRVTVVSSTAEVAPEPADL